EMPAARRSAQAAASIPPSAASAPDEDAGSGLTSTTFSDRLTAASTGSAGRPASTTTVDGLRLTRPMITPPGGR
ncbi:MAG: hypothetical protein JWO67_6272, partial [Streptosporangiaceae bacterium]|nr:hypothetical protein [Streptosporangiaceae bacterium]